MTKKLKLVYFLGLLFGIFAPCFAEEIPQQNIFFCPTIDKLQKDPEKLTWSAPGGWQSFELSFVDKITRFSGAQWRGTNVGQIFCVYRGVENTAFPILLAYSIIALEPNGGKWSQNLGGYKNCESSQAIDCPFSIRLRPEEEDLYQQAEKLKKSGSSPRTPGF